MERLDVESLGVKSIGAEREVKNRRQVERRPWTGGKESIDRWTGSHRHIEREP